MVERYDGCPHFPSQTLGMGTGRWSFETVIGDRGVGKTEVIVGLVVGRQMRKTFLEKGTER